MGVYVDNDRNNGNNDRLNAMLFVAALFHGVLILGVSFTDGELFSTGTPSTSMEVVLLAREFDERPDTNDAEYLAQQNLAGSGNTTEDRGLRVAYGRDANPVAPGPEQDGADTLQQQEQRFESADERLYARRADAGTLSTERQQLNEEMRLRTGMAGAANSVEILATPDAQTVLQGAKPRELIVSANTRESRIATYLDGWKRRIERVGTEHFPEVVTNHDNTRNPVLEVGILADGTLREVVILKGSGNRELDRAAISILRRAAPFDEFPDYLRSDYDALKFSYEWQFSSGSVGTMRAR